MKVVPAGVAIGGIGDHPARMLLGAGGPIGSRVLR
jgi:hypothetical protein